MTSTEEVLSPVKRQKLADSATSSLSPVLLGQLHRQYPVHLFEWKANQPLIPLMHARTTVIAPKPIFPSSTQLQSSTAPIQSRLPHQDHALPAQLPTIAPEHILLAHKESLPQDTIPAAFLTDISLHEKGKVILAVQFLPDQSHSECSKVIEPASLPDQSSDNSSDLASPATQSVNPFLSTKMASESSESSAPPFTTHVLGCVVALFMQFWSRFKDIEFQLKRIANIFSIFVSPSIRRCGVARTLLDALYYEFSQNYPQIDEISLEVRATNIGAQKAYKSCGFTVQREEKGYYEIGNSVKDKTCYEMVVKFDEYQVAQTKAETDGEIAVQG